MTIFAAFLACLLCIALAANGNLRTKAAETVSEDLYVAASELAADDESTAVESTEEGNSDDSEDGSSDDSEEAKEASYENSEEASDDSAHDSEEDSSNDSAEASSDDSGEGEDEGLTSAEKASVVKAKALAGDDNADEDYAAIDEEADLAIAADERGDQVSDDQETKTDASSLVQTVAKPEAKEAKEAPKKAAKAKEAASKDAKVPEIQYDDKKFGKDWHKEWKNGDFPSYKKTYSKDTFPGRKAVVAAEDVQSDGKPGVAGLSGPHVGAYLKHAKDGTIAR